MCPDKDLVRIERKIDYLIQVVDLDQAIILNTRQICSILGISRATFYNKVNILLQYGLYKEGTWKMMKGSLNTYIHENKISLKA